MGATRSAAGGYGGEAPSLWPIFCGFLEKKDILMPFWITFRMCLEPFDRTRFLTFESQLKKLNYSTLLSPAI